MTILRRIAAILAAILLLPICVIGMLVIILIAMAEAIDKQLKGETK